MNKCRGKPQTKACEGCKIERFSMKCSRCFEVAAEFCCYKQPPPLCCAQWGLIDWTKVTRTGGSIGHIHRTLGQIFRLSHPTITSGRGREGHLSGVCINFPLWHHWLCLLKLFSHHPSVSFIHHTTINISNNQWKEITEKVRSEKTVIFHILQEEKLTITGNRAGADPWSVRASKLSRELLTPRVTRWAARAAIKERAEGLNWFSPRPEEWSGRMAPVKEVSKNEEGARWTETGRQPPGLDNIGIGQQKTNYPKAIIQQYHHYIHSWKVDGRVKFSNWGIRNVWSILWPLSRPATPWCYDGSLMSAPKDSSSTSELTKRFKSIIKNCIIDS